MPITEKYTAKGRIDALGVLLLLILCAVVVGAIYIALERGWFRSPWEMAGWLGAALAFILVGLGINSYRAPKNTSVYGAAKAVSEADALAAAKGIGKKAPIHSQTFRD
jgi:uncharacterized BrkB/YihY/UPF0761 family membrane protein